MEIDRRLDVAQRVGEVVSIPLDLREMLQGVRFSVALLANRLANREGFAQEVQRPAVVAETMERAPGTIE